ncbi:MAG: tannase/feruloyl esterase family alpha/beta hydrolase [Proteobacteria bacterium]|nr:tannase/feruloyl esterase family alpha/beta hydrolase [Pseudomonadota bacterium]
MIDAVALVPAAGSLPEYCDVQGHALTSPPVDANDKGVQFEVKMPSAWNKKFLMHGNGGFGGNIQNAYSTIVTPDVDGNTFPSGYGLDRGYTIAATDTGHVGSSNIDATGFRNADGTQNVDRIINFAYRGVHITAVAAKSIMSAYYNQKPIHAYIMSESNGGRQGLIEAQRYPLDFDGVIAGAPAWKLVENIARFITMQQSQFPTYPPVNPVISIPLSAAVANETMKQCDAQDGIVDNIISDPLHCLFIPAIALPTFTSQQVATLNNIYSPVFVNGKFIVSRYLPGYESSTEHLAFGLGLGSPYAFGFNVPTIDYAFAIGTLQYMVYNDPNYILNDFDINTHLNDLFISPSGVNAKQMLDADNTNLSSFIKHGGKIIIIHGLADWTVPPGESIEYYLRTISDPNNSYSDYLRLYFVPGLFHFAIPGLTTGHDANAPTHIQALTTLENWVEKGVSPKALVASRINSSNNVDMTRLVCPYPLMAKLKPGLDASNPNITNSATNFSCIYYFGLSDN